MQANNTIVKLPEIYGKENETVAKVLNYLTCVRDIEKESFVSIFPAPVKNPHLLQNGRISVSQESAKAFADKKVCAPERYRETIQRGMAKIYSYIRVETNKEKEARLKKDVQTYSNIIVDAVFERIVRHKVQEVVEEIQTFTMDRISSIIFENDVKMCIDLEKKEAETRELFKDLEQNAIEFFVSAKRFSVEREFRKKREEQILELAEECRLLVAKRLLVKICEYEKHAKEEEIKNCLTDFAQFIPTLVQKYGNTNMTLENIEKVIPSDMFKKTMGITAEEFVFLRDGGYTKSYEGGLAYFEGAIFESNAFNSIIKKHIKKEAKSTKTEQTSSQENHTISKKPISNTNAEVFNNVNKETKQEKTATEIAVTPTTQIIENKCENIIEYLNTQNITYIDRRDKGGSLWLIGGPELQDVVDNCKSLGITFTYKANGSRATKGKKGWHS